MTLVLIDGHSIAYRSYFAFIKRPLRDPQGRNTSGVFGFLQAMDKIAQRYPTDHVVITFDAGRKVFRHEKYEDYKKERPEMPDELVWQVPMVEKIAEIQGIPVFKKEGYEADDLIATFCQRFKDSFDRVVIVASDKDLMQLIGGKVVVYDSYKDAEFDSEAVKEKLGVSPEQVTDYMAMVGDSVDAVPGVKGIGPKRAREILDKYGDLKTALKKEERLKGHGEEAELSYELVKLHSKVPIEVAKTDLKRAEPDEERLQQAFQALGFSKRLSQMQVKKEKKKEIKVKKGEFKPRKGDAVSLLFTDSQGQKDMFSEDSQPKKILASDGFSVSEISEDQARKILSEEGFPKILWAAKPLLRAGFEIEGELSDIHLLSFLENTDLTLRSLERVLVQVAGRPLRSDADAVSLMHEVAEYYEKELRNLGAWKVYADIEVPLINILANMERRGVRLDTDYFKKLTGEWEKELEKLEQEIYELAEREFTIGSPKQLSEILFEELGLRPRKRTKTGYSTAAGVLEEMRDEHPIIPKILDWRAFSKMLTTYLRPLVTLVDEDSRIHTTFDQTGAATGRLSTHDPNLQNVPIRGERGPQVRKGFTAAPGNKLISADYSQIELRVLAHISEDENLAQVFADKRDVHTETAIRIFGVEEKEVTRDHRRKAKAVNYGILYGMGPFGFARRMGVTTEEASLFIERYLASFPKVSQWREEILEEAKENGYVKTISGRIRRIPRLTDRPDIGERAALNAPIQGSAADIIKKAMIKVEKNLEDAGIEPGMLLQIHDELLFEVPEDKVEDAMKIIKLDMESAWELSVPLEVEIGAGDNWEQAH